MCVRANPTCTDLHAHPTSAHTCAPSCTPLPPAGRSTAEDPGVGRGGSGPCETSRRPFPAASPPTSPRGGCFNPGNPPPRPCPTGRAVLRPMAGGLRVRPRSQVPKAGGGGAAAPFRSGPSRRFDGDALRAPVAARCCGALRGDRTVPVVRGRNGTAAVGRGGQTAAVGRAEAPRKAADRPRGAARCRGSGAAEAAGGRAPTW